MVRHRNLYVQYANSKQEVNEMRMSQREAKTTLRREKIIVTPQQSNSGKRNERVVKSERDGERQKEQEEETKKQT